MHSALPPAPGICSLMLCIAASSHLLQIWYVTWLLPLRGELWSPLCSKGSLAALSLLPILAKLPDKILTAALLCAAAATSPAGSCPQGSRWNVCLHCCPALRGRVPSPVCDRCSPAGAQRRAWRGGSTAPTAQVVPPSQLSLWPRDTPSTCPSTSVHPPSLPTPCPCDSRLILLPRKQEHLEHRRRETQELARAPGPSSPSFSPRSALGLSAVPLPFMQTIPDGWVVPSQNCIPTCMPFFICYSKHVSFEFFIQSILASAACLGKWSHRSRLKHISLDAKRVVLF